MRINMKMLLVGAVGMLALQVVLVLWYLAASSQDPIILNPDRGNLLENGIAMAMVCGESSGVLDKVPPMEKMQARGRGEGRYGATATSTTIMTPITTHASIIIPR